MPARRVQVTFTMMSGYQFTCEARLGDSVCALKDHVKRHLGCPRWQIALAGDERLCSDETLVRNLVTYDPLPSECVIADIVPASTFMPACPLRLSVYIFTSRRTCANCGREDMHMKRCGRCLKAWYCGAGCQHDDWHVHRTQCCARR